MSYTLAETPVTIAEFELFMERQPHDTRWELVDGHILAMANRSEDHGQIAFTIGRNLGDAADNLGCRINIGGLRVQASANADGITATIPDILVRCGERVGRNWIIDPVIVVEVLPPSTMDVDRGPKLDFYKSLPSMRDIVFVYQDQVRVEHYRRDGNSWMITALTGLDDTLAFDGLPSSMNLARIYVGTALTAA